MGRTFALRYTEKNLNVYLQKKTVWEWLKQSLEEEKTGYHSYTHGKDKTHAFVLKGLEFEVGVTEIKTELQQRGIPVTEMYRMQNTRRPLYLVITAQKMTQLHLERTVRVVQYTRIT